MHGRMKQVGRYAIFDEIGAGGMATVHLARMVGTGGFSRVVAAKRMHPRMLQDPRSRRMFLSEARLAARVQHPNVLPILDVLSDGDELAIVMEYVHGESLAALMRAARATGEGIAPAVGCTIIAAMLEGLHAAHEARDEAGQPLGIVHRDVSPQNVLVGADGVVRIFDFGIAKASQEEGQSPQGDTNPGTLKGKYSYMAPEVIRSAPATRSADVFAAGVLLWEVLAGRKLFREGTHHARLLRIVNGHYPSVRKCNPAVPVALERIVERALAADPLARYETALAFAAALEDAQPAVPRRSVGDWVQRLARERLDARLGLIREIEAAIDDGAPAPERAPAPRMSVRATLVDVARRNLPAVACSVALALVAPVARHWSTSASTSTSEATSEATATAHESPAAAAAPTPTPAAPLSAIAIVPLQPSRELEAAVVDPPRPVVSVPAVSPVRAVSAVSPVSRTRPAPAPARPRSMPVSPSARRRKSPHEKYFPTSL